MSGEIQSSFEKLFVVMRAAAAGITSIPTLMIFRDGILLFSQPGALPASGLDDLISQVSALNMDEIRKEIAADKTSQ